MISAMGGYSLAMVQLHVAVATDPSKTQLDVQRWSSVTLRGQDIVIGPYKLLGAIFRTSEPPSQTHLHLLVEVDSADRLLRSCASHLP